MSVVAAPGPRAALAFHDAECGAYAADLTLWEELATERGSPLLDLGAGSGRVAIHLARRGHKVFAVERDSALAAAARTRGRDLAPPPTVAVADVRELRLGRRFALALAPMQLLQILGRAGRRRAVERIAAHLPPGGLLAAAIVEGVPDEALARRPAPLPDVRERDGWTYSSLPLGAELRGGTLRVSRLRQAVSPSGELSEELDVVALDPLDATALEAELDAAGMHPVGRRRVAATEEHVGSIVVLAEAGR